MDKLIDYEGLGTFQTNLLNDNKVSPIATWSSEKITDELATKANSSDLSSYATTSAMTTALAGKQNLLTVGDNIKISGDTISADGYKYDASNYAFATKYTYGPRHLINTASGINSFAEGQGSTASGRGSHAEGEFTIAGGDGSHAEGFKTTTTNDFEHTEGMNNVSHTDGTLYTHATPTKTIHSIGIGREDGNPDTPTIRKNAVEVMYNGDYYLYGVGNYDGIHIKNEQGAPANLQTLQEVISSLTSTIASLEARIAALENPNA